MKFKKFPLVISLVAALSASGLANAEALTDSATINFIGVFQNTTCNISLNGSDITNNGVSDLYLGAYTTDHITANADSTPAVPFAVNFTNCASIHKANISFGGTQSTASLFDVEGNNQGSVGVGINVSSTAGDYIAIGDTTSVDIKDGEGAADFYARYVKIGADPLVEGEANSTATMNVAYQ